MMSIILKRVSAERACGTRAGSRSFARLDPVRLAREANLDLTLDGDHQGVERRRVLAQPLSGIKGEEGDRARCLAQDLAAHHGSVLVGDQVGHRRGLAGRRNRARLFLRFFLSHSGMNLHDFAAKIACILSRDPELSVP